MLVKFNNNLLDVSYCSYEVEYVEVSINNQNILIMDRETSSSYIVYFDFDLKKYVYFGCDVDYYYFDDIHVKHPNNNFKEIICQVFNMLIEINKIYIKQNIKQKKINLLPIEVLLNNIIKEQL